jgi:phosphohistidine phosphatase SixA
VDTAQWLTEDVVRARLSASKVQSRLLETHSVETWEELVEYLQNLHDIMQKINQCAMDVKEIQTSTLVSIAYVGSTIDDSNERFSAHHRGRTPTSIVRRHQGMLRNPPDDYLFLSTYVGFDAPFRLV